MPLEDNSLWKRIKLAVAVLFSGVLLTHLVNLFTSGTNSNIEISLVRNFLPITVISCVVLVVGNLQSTSTVLRKGYAEVSNGQIITAIGFGLSVALSTVFIDVRGTSFRILLFVLVFSYIILTLMLFTGLCALFSRPHMNFAAFILVIPPIVSGALFNLNSPSMLQSVVILCLSQLAGLASVFATGLKIQIIQEQIFYRQLISRLAYILSAFYLLATVQVPLGFTSGEKEEFINIASISRVPLFSMATMMLILSPELTKKYPSQILQIIKYRRVALLTALGGFLCFMISVSLQFVSQRSDVGSGIFWFSCTATFLISIEIPWTIFRLMERSNQIKNTLINAACALLIMTMMSQSSISKWQMFAMVLLTARVTSEIWQHWVNSSAVLNSRRVRTKFMATYRKQLSVVIPSYNPGPAILRTLDSVHDVLASSGVSYEVIVVSDGSIDGSPDWIDSSSLVDLHVRLRTNHGKGAALREGFAVASGDVICFIDADGDIDPAVLAPMYKMISSNESDVVYGSKLHPNSNIKMHAIRLGISWLFRVLVTVLFRINVKDTQSGVKAYRGDLLRSALPLMRESGFNLDLEIFVLSKQLGYDRFAEHPISLNRAGESSVKLSTLFSMFWSTISMYWRVHLTLEYNELIEHTQE